MYALINIVYTNTFHGLGGIIVWKVKFGGKNLKTTIGNSLLKIYHS